VLTLFSSSMIHSIFEFIPLEEKKRLGSWMGTEKKNGENNEDDFELEVIKCRLTSDEIDSLNLIRYSIYTDTTVNFNYKLYPKHDCVGYSGELIEICPFRDMPFAICPNCEYCKYNVRGEEN